MLLQSHGFSEKKESVRGSRGAVLLGGPAAARLGAPGGAPVPPGGAERRTGNGGGGAGGEEAPPAPAVQKKKVFYILNIHSKERLWSRGLTVYLQRAATGGRRTAGTGSGSGTGSGAAPTLRATLQ